MGEKVDNLDLKIIHQLQQNGRISITELADNIHSSRPTTTNRLKKLVDKNVVMVKGGLNISKFGFKMACIGLEVTDGKTLGELESTMRCCPRVMNIYRTTTRQTSILLSGGKMTNQLTLQSNHTEVSLM